MLNKTHWKHSLRIEKQLACWIVIISRSMGSFSKIALPLCLIIGFFKRWYIFIDTPGFSFQPCDSYQMGKYTTFAHVCFFFFQKYGTLLFWQLVMPSECCLEAWCSWPGQSNISFISAVSFLRKAIIAKTQTFNGALIKTEWGSRWSSVCLAQKIKATGISIYIREKRVMLGHSRSYDHLFKSIKSSSFWIITS